MHLSAAIRCMVNGMLAAVACVATPSLANQPGAERTVRVVAPYGEFAPEVLPGTINDAGDRQSWDTRLSLTKNIDLRAGGITRLIAAPGDCAISGLAAKSDGGCLFNARNRFPTRTYTFGLDARIDDAVTLYARTGRAYRIGKAQLRDIGMIGGVDTSIVAGSEVRYEHQVGIRGELLDRKVTLNVAGYYNKLKNFQTTPTYTTLTGARLSAVVNPSTLRNMGIEADLTVRPVAGLSLYGSLATNHEKFKHCAAGFCPGHARDIVQTQVNVGANGERDLGFGTLGLNVNYNWTGRGHLATDAATTAAIAARRGISPDAVRRRFGRRAAATLDARVSLSLADTPVEFYAYGRNLTDQRYMQHRRFAVDVATAAMWNDPRTFGVGAKMAF